MNQPEDQSRGKRHGRAGKPVQDSLGTDSDPRQESNPEQGLAGAASRATDAALVRATLAGDQRAFQDLVERYSERTFSLVRHYARNAVEVEDIVQDTFLKAFSKLASFQHQSSFSTWLFRIAVNTALDFLKRAGRSPVQSVEDPEALTTSPMDPGPRIAAPDAGLEQQERVEITHRCLEELPDIFRTTLVLRELDGMAYQDIADQMGVSIGTVESRLFRARARFREALINLYPEYAGSSFS